jgi:predicted nucleic acid-binding protein
MIVVDASTVVAWYLEREEIEAQAVLAEVLERGALVPGNFLGEIAQSLLRAQRAGRISTNGILSAVESLSALNIAVEPASLPSMLELATKYSLSSYDAGYLAVANARRTRLATRDKALIAAAKAEGCLWTPPPPHEVEKKFSLLLAG